MIGIVASGRFEAEQQVTEATIAAKKQEIMRLKEWLDKEMLEKETTKREETKMRADFQPLKQHNYQLKSKNTKLQLRVDELVCCLHLLLCLLFSLHYFAYNMVSLSGEKSEQLSRTAGGGTF